MEETKYYWVVYSTKRYFSQMPYIDFVEEAINQSPLSWWISRRSSWNEGDVLINWKEITKEEYDMALNS